MNKFITYKHPSGQFVIIKRSEISSFRPVFVNKHQYRVMATVGREDFAVQDVETLQAAEEWILGQIKVLESEESNAGKK